MGHRGPRFRRPGMSSKRQHPYLAFAARYADPTQNYLNAYIALARCEALLDDLSRVSSMLKANDPPERRWAPWFGAEIISYYAVGFVTCLEWHARSRLVDILTFDPRSLRTEDLKGVINDRLILQMISEQAPVTHLIGGAVRITSADRYYSVLSRVFADLDICLDLVSWLTGSSQTAFACWIHPDQMHMLDGLFKSRHELVHEIGSATMGHPNIRESWSPDEALAYGRLTLSIMSGIEAAFTRYAPKSFPNLLTEEGGPISSVEQLSVQLTDLSEAAELAVVSTDWDHPNTTEAWAALRTAGHAYFEAEERFIERASMLQWRYFDARAPLRLMSLQYRIAFLREVLSHCAPPEEGETR